MSHIMIFSSAAEGTSMSEKFESRNKFHYGFELAFAIIVTVMLWNIFMVVKLRYGNMNITHHTARPHIISMFLLTASLVEVVIYLLVTNVFFDNWITFLGFYKEHYLMQTIVALVLYSKYSLILIYMLARTYEHFSLHFFISYQKSCILQNLEPAKEEFNKKEKIHHKAFNIVSFVIALPLLVWGVLPAKYLTNEDAVVSFANLYFVVGLVFVTSAYISTEVPLLRDMRKFHRFEYEKHSSRMLVIFVITTLSLCSVILFETGVFYSYVCAYGFFINGEDQLAIFDPFVDKPGMCLFFDEYYIKMFGTTQNIGFVLWIVDFTILIPPVTFFFLDNPHDCFVCFGKDPDRIYSIFQLTREDRTNRKLKARLGSKRFSEIKKNRHSLV